MNESRPALNVEPMRRGRAPEDYRLYRAALEWDLIDPIVIDNREDLKSEATWQGRLNPYDHQVSNLITFCRRLPVTLLADDVGLGKTISAGLVISELVARSRVNKVLVVCPKLLGPQWQEELETKFKLEAKVAVGQDLLEADISGPGAVITTYHSARAHLDTLPKDRFDMLILDEAHKLRNLHGTDAPPQVAERFRAALEERRFRYVLMLTATPIHNRLWDLYSLVELLTVARGHRNPFGSEGEFARKFIGDGRTSARVLKQEARDEFRSIVYGYMSRVRRADANLHFPERVVRMQQVAPTAAEWQLLEVLVAAIRKLGPLAQISLLQAYVSSPHALLAQIANMARKGTVKEEIRSRVAAIVNVMPESAKLQGLATLMGELKAADPSRWRAVVFTTRLETQTTIEAFLSRLGLKVGTINGSSGARNQQTLSRFRKNPPECNVIVSTEAGAEGVNLQAANVLVNFDLPWNPMIVEQRIGRVQRLASNYERVVIYNVILAGTFEERIVARLMQKLQMASQAIGDIESILEAAGMDEDEGQNSFEEQIRRLVLKALEERDYERDALLAEQSIERAKASLVEHRETLEQMLGGGSDRRTGPRPPDLPKPQRSLNHREFAMRALAHLGGRISQGPDDTYVLHWGQRQERICFHPDASRGTATTVYAPGTRAFEQLVDRMVQAPLHAVSERATDVPATASAGATKWVDGFGGQLEEAKVRDVQRGFDGTVVVRARVTVAHDSYERLVPVSLTSRQRRTATSSDRPIREPIDRLAEVGVDESRVLEAALSDHGVADFCRFYRERQAEEVSRAGSDAKRAKKLTDEFTPRVALTAVGLEGVCQPVAYVDVQYRIDKSPTYSDLVVVAGPEGAVIEAPRLVACDLSARSVPETCLAKCEVSGRQVLKHLLRPSDLSGRMGCPDRFVTCAASGKLVLDDEVEVSGVTGKPVLKTLIQTSEISGIKGEPSLFGVCQMTGSHVLQSELTGSEFSGKKFRSDQAITSAISGKAGHKSEMFTCARTGKVLGKGEGERCAVTGVSVAPGVLAECQITSRRVLPEELGICATTRKSVCRSLLVESSVSRYLVLEKVAVKARNGKYCLPSEGRQCRWTDRNLHPDDAGSCSVTGLTVDKVYLTSEFDGSLKEIPDLLRGMTRPSDAASDSAKIIAALERATVGGKLAVEATLLSPSGRALLTGFESRTFLGFRVQHGVAVVDVKSGSVIGKVALGRRSQGTWTPG